MKPGYFDLAKKNPTEFYPFFPTSMTDIPLQWYPIKKKYIRAREKVSFNLNLPRNFGK